MILLAVIFWGASFAATKIALLEIEPVTIIILRLILASLLLFVYAVITRKSFTINFKSHLWIFILALIAAFHLWVQVTGLKYTTASNTGCSPPTIIDKPAFFAPVSPPDTGASRQRTPFLPRKSATFIAISGEMVLIST